MCVREWGYIYERVWVCIQCMGVCGDGWVDVGVNKFVCGCEWMGIYGCHGYGCECVGAG